MTITFADLAKIYRQSEFVENSNKAIFCSNSAEDVELLKLLSSDEHFDESGIQTDSNELEANQSIPLIIGSPTLALGRLYDDFEGFVKGDMAHLHNSKISNKPYFIKSEKVAFDDVKKPQYLLNYEGIKAFLHQLISMTSYSDNVNKKLIFFSKKTFELSIDVSKQLLPFCNLLRELDGEQLQLICGLGEWLNSEETSTHIDEKKSILAFVFSDSLPQEATIIDVLKQIKRISEAVQNQYQLYLENFSYEKFVKKLEENSAKFTTKINDTINKVLSQILGLPIATAVPVALKTADNWLVYIALLIYCSICFLALSNQKIILDHLLKDVTDFEQDGKIPPSEKLKQQWNEDKHHILMLIDKQNTLYKVLMFTIIMCIGYSSYKLGYQLGIAL